MIKKIMMWTIYTGIVGVLIFGAVNRTQAKSGQEIQIFSGLRSGSAYQAGADQNNTGTVEAGGEDHDSSIEVPEWVEETGWISSYDTSSLLVETGQGEILEIEGRSWRFAQESGYSPTEGNEVVLVGFIENGEFELAIIHDLDAGETVPVRDDYGRPLWSGRGK